MMPNRRFRGDPCGVATPPAIVSDSHNVPPSARGGGVRGLLLGLAGRCSMGVGWPLTDPNRCARRPEVDCRVRERLEKDAGLPIQTFPDRGVRVCVSDARTDEPKNRLLAQRVAGKDGVLVTGIPRVVEAVSAPTQSLTAWELFSPVGLAEVRRALPSADAEHFDEAYLLDYVLAEHERFRPAKAQHKAIALGREDIPSEQSDLRMGERRTSETNDFTWAFACYHDDPNAPATELAPFGPCCASIAIIIWRSCEEIATYGVGTEEAFRGQGYGLASVSAATKWILAQGAVAWYGAYADNVPSLRIARRLGFSLACQSFRA